MHFNHLFNPLQSAAFIKESFAVIVSGVQNVSISRNIFRNPEMTHEMMAALTAASANYVLDVEQNYWGTEDQVSLDDSCLDSSIGQLCT